MIKRLLSKKEKKKMELRYFYEIPSNSSKSPTWHMIVYINIIKIRLDRQEFNRELDQAPVPTTLQNRYSV